MTGAAGLRERLASFALRATWKLFSFPILVAALLIKNLEFGGVVALSVGALFCWTVAFGYVRSFVAQMRGRSRVRPELRGTDARSAIAPH